MASSSGTAPPAPAGSTPRGAFIVLEGLDRSGKTTQVKLLEQRFVEEGRPVKTMRFPDRTTAIGTMIDGYLKSNVELEDHAIHLLFSANRWEAATSIETLLRGGTSVICDRYYHSGMVYSAAKGNPSLTLGWARRPDVGLPRPDLVLFLDLDEDAAAARGGWGDEAYERADMQRRVRELFRALLELGEGAAAAGQGRQRGPAGRQSRAGQAGPGWEGAADEDGDLLRVDAGGSVEQVAEEIWERVRQRAEQVSRGELGSVVRRVC